MRRLTYSIRNVHNLETFLEYSASNLGWKIDITLFEDIEDITYDFDAEDLGLKPEEFKYIKTMRQLRPINELLDWGIFFIDFKGDRLNITALRKILSRLVPSRRNIDFATWQKERLLFICFWGNEYDRHVGLVKFEDVDSGLPKIKALYCAPKLEDRFYLQEFEGKLSFLKWPPNDNEKNCFDTWNFAFDKVYKETIKDSRHLSLALAKQALSIKDGINRAIKIENRNGEIRSLFNRYVETYGDQATVSIFTDMYAQTIVYGLFTARCSSINEEFDINHAIEKLPVTNMFLRDFLKECYSLSEMFTYDEFDIASLVDILANTDVDSILKDFNRLSSNGKDDPVLYFYEGFLDVYEKQEKKRRGVYYTPYSVVDFITRSSNSILRSKLGIRHGFASDKIVVLDPASGTGTFLRRAILQAHEDYKMMMGENFEKKAWNSFISTNILGQFFGFELMMAPYAVSHMKLSMLLQDLGYDFSSNAQLEVTMRDTLVKSETSFEEMYYRRKIESHLDQISNNDKTLVVIGNPPYHVESKNKGDWILSLMEDYKLEPNTQKRLVERNMKVINDDYVKFIRYTHNLASKHDNAIISFIVPHSFIDNLTFRGMRWQLLRDFDEIYILNLHGNIMSKIKFEGVEKDENIFDIQQGVCIFFLVKHGNNQNLLADTYYSEMMGSREMKNNRLISSSIEDIEWEEVEIQEPNYFLKPFDYSNIESYRKGIDLSELFPTYLGGVKTHNDGELVSFEPFRSKENQPYDYRPFDKRYINYDRNLVQRDRYKVMKNFIDKDNYGLVISRQVKCDDWSHIQIVRSMIDNRIHYSRKGIAVLCPMYIYDDDGSRSVNVNIEIIAEIENNIQMDFDEKCDVLAEKKHNMFNMMNLYDYIYSVLNSSRYISAYKDYLCIDFPKVPYPKNKEMFLSLCEIGSRLRKLHFMEESSIQEILKYVSSGDDIITISPKNQGNRVYINGKSYFEGITEEVWNFTFGGYKPAQKWLKDRKGHRLSNEEIRHYIKMIGVFNTSNSYTNIIDDYMEKYYM